ncbi:MAG: hypothetical protein LQ351_005909 [Letrouitia transgressa]|nr:MAG: hypothetical protein LQ351_005909 [Letrouitia transgressa]
MTSSANDAPESLAAVTYTSPKRYGDKYAAESQAAPPAAYRPQSDQPVIANFDSNHLTIGAGVAIFHIATARVVVCYHSIGGYWFLPKGRRDAGEDSATGAEREGFEESGYRNRLLPLPLRHRQPKPHNASAPPGASSSSFFTEPVWTQFAPVGRGNQYILFWYIAETLPPDLEALLSARAAEQAMAHQVPPRYPEELTLAKRVAMEPEGYAPVRHAGTGVDEEEALYEAYLLPVDEAIGKLGRSVMADVVRRGWEGICARREMEE